MIRQQLEENQIGIYLLTLVLAVGVGYYLPAIQSWQVAIEPAIGLLLFTMFCQIPFHQLKYVWQQQAFFKALVVGSFLFIPLLIGLLLTVFPMMPQYQLGVLLVL